MVALLVRLKLTLLRNGLKRNIWRTVGLVLGLLYGLGIVVFALVGLVALRFASVELTADVTVLVFGVLTLGWLLMSLLVFGVDETVDPSKFALLPLRARDLLPGLFVSGLLGIPGMATLLVSLGLVVSWSRGAVTVVASLIAIVLGVATCFLLSRAATAAAARFLSSRRFRDLAAVLFVFVGLLFGVGGNLFGGFASRGVDMRVALTDMAEVMGWTPFGWAWAVPAEVATGNWAGAGLRLLLAAALVVLLWVGWGYFLDKRLTEPIEAGSGQQKVRAQSWIEQLFPATPAGGVAGRTLRYWRRDPRYLASIAGFMIAPIAIIVSQTVGGGSQPLVIAFAPALLGLLMGMTLAQDLSYDGTAVWLHISTGVTGAEDRAGRAMSTVTVLGPILVLLLVVTTLISRQWDLVIPIVGLTIGVTMIGIGVGSWVGALWQYPTPPPGASPFQKGSSGGLPSLLSFSVTSLAIVVLIIPAVALMIGSIWITWLGYLAALVALLIGGVAVKVGIAQGGKLLDRRWPEVLLAVSEDR